MRRILYVQYTNPAGYPPLEHSSRIFADQGWEVLFLGSGAQGLADGFRFEPHPRIQTKRWQYQRPGLRQKLHYLAFSLWAALEAKRFGAEWVYASDFMSCPSALLARRWLGLRVVYHEHDSPAEVAGNGFLQRLLGFRRTLAREADLVILPNAERARLFVERTGCTKPVHVVWNCPERREVKARFPAPGGPEILFYHGSLNQGVLPVSVLDAMRLAPENLELRFAGYSTHGTHGFVPEFLAEAAQRGLQGRVKYLGAFSRYELMKHTAQATLGLAFMPKRSSDVNMVAMTGASNKAFDYLACGLGLLVSDLPEWLNMFVQPGYAVACDPESPASIARAITWFVEHPREAAEMRARGKQKILDAWNYETQFAPALERIETTEKQP